MALDQTQNFVEVDIVGTYTSTDTTISLESGGASEVPDPANGEYNLVWFDAENNAKPSLDPEVEIVRVTGRDTGNDTLTVQRGQENTSAVAHDTSNADYKFLLTPTSKMISDIDNANFTTNSLTIANTTIALGETGIPEADNLAGNNGTSGQVLQTDGSNVSWTDVSAGGKFEDALANGKVLADDGNLYNTVQDAVNNASVDGFVLVGKGNFNESVTVSTSGLTLTGFSKKGSIIGNTTSSKVLLTIDANNITVKNITLKTDNQILDATNTSNGNNLTIDSIDSETGFLSLKFNACDKLSITNSRLKSTSGNIIDLTDCVEVNISNNKILGDGSSITAAGIFCTGTTKNVLIKSNICNGANNLVRSNKSAESFNVVGNNVINTVDTSISLNNGNGKHTISNNQIIDSQGGGINIGLDSVCTDNFIQNSTDWGILFSSSSDSICNSNVIKGNNKGIDAFDSDTIIITSNRIYNNNTNTDLSDATNVTQNNNIIG